MFYKWVVNTSQTGIWTIKNLFNHGNLSLELQEAEERTLF